MSCRTCVMMYKPESLLEVVLLGNIVNKYKVNELARDFGMQTKQIIEILGKYFDTPKKSGQNLEDRELNVLFEHLTQNNQISSIQSIYADTPPAEKAKPAPAESSAPRGRDQGGKKPQNGRGGSEGGKPRQNSAPAKNPPQSAPQPPKGQGQQAQPPASGQSPVQGSSVQDSSAAPQNGTDEIAED